MSAPIPEWSLSRRTSSDGLSNEYSARRTSSASNDGFSLSRSPIRDDELARFGPSTGVSSPLARNGSLSSLQARRHTVSMVSQVQQRVMDSDKAVRRKSIDQVLETMMDSKQKEAIFDSPKTMNKHQKNLSKSGGLMVVGNYRIGETIGKGRYSVVKLATHVLTNEFVAIKIVAKAKLSREDMRVLQREMQIMKLLDHPNIVRLYEVIDTTEHFYLVLEYVNGRTLSDKIPDIHKLKKKKRGAMVQHIFQQLASAVAYIHAKHVVHRDIKTDNLLVEDDWTVKLADWGFSNLSQGLLNTHCGTPYYASPELFRPQAYSGPPSDVWAMGVLLYYMYVGKLPFREDPIREFIKQGVYKMPKDLPAEVRVLIASMLRVNSDKRITAVEVNRHPWVTGVASSAPVPVSDGKDEGASEQNHRDAIELMIHHLGFTSDEIMQSLNSNIYDQVAATYYLLRDSPKLDVYRMYLLVPNGSSTASSHPNLTESGDATPKSLARRLSRALSIGSTSNPPSAPGSPSSVASSPSRRRSNASRMFNFLLGRSSASLPTDGGSPTSVPGSPATAGSASASSEPGARVERSRSRLAVLKANGS